MNQRETFAHFEICQDDGGGPIEVPSHTGEVACMAWDREQRVLVALHLIPASCGWTVRQREAFAERASLAREVHMPAVAQMLSWGVHEGMSWYACALEPGEPVDSWLGRLGPAPDVLALHLALRLCENLLELQRFGRVFRSVTLANTFLIDQPGRSVLLHVRDLGLAENERRNGVDEADVRLAAETLDLFASLLTGGTLELARVELLRGNPRLQEAVRVARGLISGKPWSLEQVQEALRSEFQRAAGLAPAERSLEVTVESARRPRPVLQRALLGHREPSSLLPPQFGLKASDFPRPELLTRHAQDARRSIPVLLHLLPPERVVSRASFQPVPAAARTARKFSHLMLPGSVWESEQMCFVVEDSPAGCSLAQILERRMALGAEEGGRILGAVCLALRQAAAAGVTPPALHPAEILIASPGASEEQLTSLQDLPLSHWPAPAIRLRLASSARSLCAPWLMLESVLRQPEDQRIAAGFAALADAVFGGVERADRTGLPGPALAVLVGVRRALARGQKVPAPEELLKQLAPAASEILSALPPDASLPLPATAPVPALVPVAAMALMAEKDGTSEAGNDEREAKSKDLSDGNGREILSPEAAVTIEEIAESSTFTPEKPLAVNEGPRETFIDLPELSEPAPLSVLADTRGAPFGDSIPSTATDLTPPAETAELPPPDSPAPRSVRVPRTVAEIAAHHAELAAVEEKAESFDSQVASNSLPVPEADAAPETAVCLPDSGDYSPPLLRLVKSSTQPVPSVDEQLPTLSMDLDMLAADDLLRRHVRPSPYTGKRL